MAKLFAVLICVSLLLGAMMLVTEVYSEQNDTASVTTSSSTDVTDKLPETSATFTTVNEQESQADYVIADVTDEDKKQKKDKEVKINESKNDKKTKKHLLENLEPEDGDVVIVSSSDDPFVAEISAKNSALWTIASHGKH